jgi:hypothetical protein
MNFVGSMNGGAGVGSEEDDGTEKVDGAQDNA